MDMTAFALGSHMFSLVVPMPNLIKRFGCCCYCCCCCSHSRVKLALLLEGMCSRLANHHLAIPFLRPFLPGIASAKRSSPSGIADADGEADEDGGVKREGVGGYSPSGAKFSASARGRDSGERLKAPAAGQGVDNAERRTLDVDPAGYMPTGGSSLTAGNMGPAALTSRDEGIVEEVVRNGSSKTISSPSSPFASSPPGGMRGAGKRGRRGKSTAAPCATVEAPACAPAKTNTRNSPTSLGGVTAPGEVEGESALGSLLAHRDEVRSVLSIQGL